MVTFRAFSHYLSRQRSIWFLGMPEMVHLSPIYLPFCPFFGLENPSNLSNRVTISLPRTEWACRGYVKAGFHYESSRSAQWGKKGHHASEWQRWKKVPTWSMGVPKRHTNTGNSRDSDFLGIPVTFSFFLLEHVQKSPFLVDRWESWWTHASDCASFCTIVRLFDNNVLFWPAMFSLMPHTLKLFVYKKHCNSLNLNPVAFQDVG